MTDTRDSLLKAAMDLRFRAESADTLLGRISKRELLEFADRLTALQSGAGDVARPLDEYHEDMGPVTWWKFPINEASYIGSPNFDDWPGYHTHFTPHPAMPSNHEAIDNAQATEGK